MGRDVSRAAFESMDEFVQLDQCKRDVVARGGEYGRRT